jgi:RNA polymerase sigma factor (sigma-70 family)
MEPENVPDLALRAVNGDQEAFKYLYTHYSHHLKRVIEHRLNRRVRKARDMDDAYDSFWVRVLGSEGWVTETFTSEEGFVAFLRSYARSYARDVNRKHLDAQKRDMRAEVPLTDDVPHKGPSVQEVVEKRDLYDCVMEASPQELRSIYYHSKKEGISMRQAADQLGVPRRRYESLIEAAREEFKRRARRGRAASA